MAIKQDSNLTGLSFAEEASLRTLPGTPKWFGLEPNSYSDFGGQLATVARNPINPTRQRKKGTVTDLDASGGFNQDLTISNMTRLMQGFCFADAREKPTTAPLNADAVAITGVTTAADTYAAASGLGGFRVSALVLASGFGQSANNGLKNVVSRTAGTLVVSQNLVDEPAPPAAAKLVEVGLQLGAATSAIALNGDLVRLTDSATDFTTLGLLRGEWLFVGGDGATNRFTNNAPGFARISAITAGYLEFDKVGWTPAAEAGTGKSIHIFWGTVIRNEPAAADIVRRTYQVERTLGEDNDGTMSEYLIAAVPNELTFNIPTADKITVDMSFVALDNEQRTGLQGVKAGTRIPAQGEDALNTSNDFNRIKLASVSLTDATPADLFAYASDLTLTINNNVQALKAIGTLGGFETSAGTFEVGGQFEVYFADVTAVQAVRNNADVTLDFAIVKASQGMLFDIPLISLGDGRLNIEQDQPIKLPLENNAAESPFGYTLLVQQFPYLPAVAA